MQRGQFEQMNKHFMIPSVVLVVSFTCFLIFKLISVSYIKLSNREIRYEDCAVCLNTLKSCCKLPLSGTGELATSYKYLNVTICFIIIILIDANKLVV